MEQPSRRIGASRNKKRGHENSIWYLFVHNPKGTVGLIILGVFIAVAIFGPFFAPYNPNTPMIAPELQAPTWNHLMGTTNEGQDVLSQFLYGTRASMAMGLGAGTLATIIALFMGAFGGYKGGVTDTILNTATNIMLVLPGFPLLIVFVSYLPRSGPVTITLIIALTGWAGAARTKRSQAMTFRNKDFILAAKLSGASDLRILFVEVLPNMLSFIFNNFIFACLGAILAQSGLAVIGIGSPFTASWGNILNLAIQGNAVVAGAWWWFVPPGLAIAVVGLGFTLMNYAMDEVSNPRLRRIKVRRSRKSAVALAE